MCFSDYLINIIEFVKTKDLNAMFLIKIPFLEININNIRRLMCLLRYCYDLQGFTIKTTQFLA